MAEKQGPHGTGPCLTRPDCGDTLQAGRSSDTSYGWWRCCPLGGQGHTGWSLGLAHPLSAVAQEPTIKPAPGKVRKQGLEAICALDVYLVSTYFVLRPNNRTLQLQPTRQGPGLHGA